MRVLATRRFGQESMPVPGQVEAVAGIGLDVPEYATLQWVDWYNNRRLLEPIGNIPPAEAEAAYFASLEETAIAA